MTVKEKSSETLNYTAVLAHSERFGEPAWLKLAREAAWEAFSTMPWPNYKEETWRRTRLTGFDLKNYPHLVLDEIEGWLVIAGIDEQPATSNEQREPVHDPRRDSCKH
jgi:hypothetical protein